MQPVHDTRVRIMTATAELFRRQGYNGTGLKAVTVAADAPFGSLYHHFPGGKVELAEAVIESSGAAYGELFVLIWDAATDPAAAVTDFFDGAAAVLEETDYVDACPIGTVALEVASVDDRLRSATDRVFVSWVDAAASRLTAVGIEAAEARELAITFVAAIEGGFMLSRAARSPEPMRAAGRQMRRLLEVALTDVPATR
jgi:AcrR family transcriptional regulator